MVSTFVVKDENEDIRDLLDDIRRVREFISNCKDEEKRLMQLLYNKVNEHERIITVDSDGVEKELATWKYSAEKKMFNTKLFKELQPDIYKAFEYSQAGSRTLRIKE